MLFSKECRNETCLESKYSEWQIRGGMGMANAMLAAGVASKYPINKMLNVIHGFSIFMKNTSPPGPHWVFTTSFLYPQGMWRR